MAGPPVRARPRTKAAHRVEPAHLVPPLLAAALLAAVHLTAAHLRVLQVVPRSRWLSFAGGIAVSYVFVRILPELAKAQRAFEDAPPLTPAWLEHHVYLLALAGLVSFYAVARLVQKHRDRRPAHRAPATDAAFWLHIGSFAVYNALIGYLLHSRASLAELFWFTLAVGMHFLVTDYSLREDHRHLYNRYARWLLAAAILAGWALGAGYRAPERAFAALLGFVSGAIVLNAIKEELPRERESRIWPFLAGAALHAALLLATSR